MDKIISEIPGYISDKLNLDFNNVTDVSSLLGLTSLVFLLLDTNNITTGVDSLTGLINAFTIDFTGNINIPCADLVTLELALGPGIITHPSSCI